MGKDYYVFKKKGRGIWFVEYEKLNDIKNTNMNDFDIDMLNDMFILRTDEEEFFMKTVLRKNLFFPREDCFPFEKEENLNLLKDCEEELDNPSFHYFLLYLQGIRVVFLENIEKENLDDILFMKNVNENFK
tara:strand:- start:63 stop:455 length:393 start_codon:yes stop_codon:yes gene_type:complete